MHWLSLKRIRKKDPFHLELGSTPDISIMIKPTKIALTHKNKLNSKVQTSLFTITFSLK
jgi:hypothetical protein